MPATPETAGMPRLRARMAAWLVPPPVSVTIPAIGRRAQVHRLAGQDLVGDEDDRLVAFVVGPAGRPGTWTAASTGASRSARSRRGRRRSARGSNRARSGRTSPRSPARPVCSAERAVKCWTSIRSWTLASSAWSLTICRWLWKMLGLGAAELLGDLRDDRLELRDRERHGALETLDLGRDLARVGQHLRLARPEHRVDSVGDPDHDARADRNSFVHNTLSLAKPRSLAQT